jgi:putative DNA primase/helicase
MDDASDKFVPLTLDEIAAAPAAAAPTPDDDELVSPVPPDAPEPPQTHPALGPPTVAFVYRDANGATLQLICRFDPPGQRKQIVPCTLWRDVLGLRWRWRGLPAPRPLYGLDRLTARPDAPVIVCEGEKAAEAATRIFPCSVVVTSCGGANAARQTDWRPLAGRGVLIWPDADEPGARYARDVANILSAIGCNVSTIDAMALAAICPASSARRDPVTGWDAADAADEWEDVDSLRQAAHGLTKAYDPGPAFVSHNSFAMREDGLWYTAPGNGKTDGDDEDACEVWLCGPFEIPGRIRDTHGGQWARLLRWKDEDGREHNAPVNDADLHGVAGALAAKLAQGGLRIATGRGNRERLIAYLNGAIVRTRITIVDRTGWHEVRGRSVFVLPASSAGAPAGETVILKGGVTAAYGSKGTLHNWCENVGKRAGTHARAVLALSVAFAGPLLQLTGQDGFGVNLYGSSSRGKTTLLQAAASVWGGPSFLKAWRATGNALEASAALASDTLLCLDEIGTVEARDAGSAVYALFNGQGKGRSGQTGDLRASKSWRIVLLSSGEMPMSAKVAEGGKRAMAGQAVRMLDIQADAGRDFGCFDHGVDGGDAGPIANAIKQASRENYGVAGPEFVRRIVADGVDIVTDDCNATIAAFVETNVEPGADGQVSRVAARFALIGVAGELAALYGLTGWQKGASMNAARAVFAEWIEARGGIEPSETSVAISTVRRYIEANGDARFEHVGNSDHRIVVNRAGYRKGTGAAQEWWCLPETWKSDICVGLDPVSVAKALAGCGLLRLQGDKLQCNVRVGDRTIRAYVITAKIFEGASDAE